MHNFIDWLNEAKEERVYVYHGTSSNLLNRIMSEGLNPYPKQRTWHADPDSSFTKASRASYGGIYVTTNLLTATGSAWKAKQKFGGNELVVVMNIHPYSMVADEDDFMSLANTPIPGLLTTEFSLAHVYMPMMLIKKISNLHKNGVGKSGKLTSMEFVTIS